MKTPRPPTPASISSRPIRLLALLAMVVALLTAKTGQSVSGRVYLDGASDVGLSDVLVSNGRQVVTTDASGRYELPSKGPVLLWITVPRDHAARTAFWRWSDGARKEDFALVRQPQPDAFAFVQITDTHVGRADLVREFLERINKFPPSIAFVVNTGDLGAGVDKSPPEKSAMQYAGYLSVINSCKRPLWNLPGNHEHVGILLKEADQSDPRYGKGYYRQVLGPLYYSWDWGPVHFVALDGTTLPYREKLGPEQLAWLAADLCVQPREKPLVLFCHQSLPALADAQELAALLRDRKVLAGFCGHLHTTFTTHLGDIPVYHTGALCGSWWSGPNSDGTPQGFRLVQIAPDGLKTAYFNRTGAHFPAVVGPPANEVLTGGAEMEVNVLDFGRPVELTARFDGRIASLELARRESLWSVWKGAFDTRPALDGQRVLKIASQLGNEMSWTETRYLVCNGRAEPYRSDAPAVLRLQVRTIHAADQVLLNGKPLGTIPATTPNETVLEFTIPAERLTRMNRVTIRAAIKPGNDLDDFSVGPISMQYRDKPLYDLRYPTFARHLIGDADPKRYKPEWDLFFCLP